MKKPAKDLHYYMSLDYTIRLKENTDQTYFAEIEELPGCMTEGDTREEAIKMIEDAKNEWLATALTTGISIPEPTGDEYSGKLNVRLPKHLHRRLSYLAKEEGVSLNTLISSGLSLWLGDRSKDIYRIED